MHVAITSVEAVESLFMSYSVSSPVASAPTLESLQQISATSVRVMWSQPSGGAPVAGYEVHYRTGSSVTIKPEPPSSTTTEITGLTDGSTYTISVEATSQHLSGESEEMTIKLCKPYLVSAEMICFPIQGSIGSVCVISNHLCVSSYSTSSKCEGGWCS